MKSIYTWNNKPDFTQSAYKVLNPVNAEQTLRFNAIQHFYTTHS